MPAQPSSGAAMASGDDSKPANRGWNPEDSITLLLIIMQENNQQLSVAGWKSIKDRAQKVFDGKYGEQGAKHQFQKLRGQFMKKFPIPETKGKEVAKNSSPSKKRNAPSTDDDGIGASDGNKSKKLRGDEAEEKAEKDDAELNRADTTM